jgi:multimeric flavodoxin WrbA
VTCPLRAYAPHHAESGGHRRFAMRVLAVNASPNKDGLTALSAEAFLAGAQEAGAEVDLIHLCDKDLRRCVMCENGWGKCRREGECVLDDDFADVRRSILDADVWVLATPVYFGEPSEVARAVLDRLRRCNTGPLGGQLSGKDLIGICAAGGSGRGIGTCGEVLERFVGHMGMRLADLITVTRRSKLYKIDTMKAAGKGIVVQNWDE